MQADLKAFLIQHDFDPQRLDAPRQHGLTPLMRAALAGRDDWVHGLLQLGASVHLLNEDGNNALWLACVGRNAAVIRRLAQAGIDLNHRNAVGATALMYAASSGKADVVQQLLALGADPHLQNQDGTIAVEMAATRECLALLRHTLS